jgi:hypothetical protein
MAYQLDRFNGTFLVNVDDGSIETNSTDIRFVGKNYAGYGEVQNENFLHLLENFANSTPPPRAISGQIWYDSLNKRLRYYDGARFRLAGGAETGTVAPTGLVEGEFWFDTSSKQLYTWSGTNFVLIGPESSPDLGVAAASPQIVKDTLGTNHTILRFFSSGRVIGVVSEDEFELDRILNPINNPNDFQFIKKGFNLVETNPAGVSQGGFVYWGTSSNALKLGGVDASNFVQKGNITFDQEIKFNDPGLQLGNNNDLRIKVDNGNLIFENRLGNPFRFRISEGSLETDILFIEKASQINPARIRPGSNGVFNIGEPNFKWNQIFANTVVSNVTGNVTGNTTGQHRGDVVSPVDNTVIINGTTKQIGYADAVILGTLIGSVQGGLSGTATNASRLTNLAPSINVPLQIEATIPIRDLNGNIFANQFVGVSDKSDRLKIDNSAVDTDPNYRSARTTPTGNSIAARDSSGNIQAVLFQGTATAARYADLAEKYIPDEDYEVGTVVSVGGTEEITASSLGDRAIGAISSNPAFMMNKDLEGGVYVALKGRVPVKVVGIVKKGQRLIASDNGYAMVTSSEFGNVFAIALEDSDDINVKLIESVIL